MKDESKVIYAVQGKHSHVEEEIKIQVSDISSMLNKIRKIAKYSRTLYIRDIIYGTEDKKKIRLRIQDNFEFQSLNAIYKYKVSIQDGIKKEIEEIIYKGNSKDEALAMISLQGTFKEENSYEKTRHIFLDENHTEITIDIYPYGCWMEIEGKPQDIHKAAASLGCTPKDYITSGADDLYLEWIKRHNLPEMWDVRFGLTGKK